MKMNRRNFLKSMLAAGVARLVPWQKDVAIEAKEEALPVEKPVCKPIEKPVCKIASSNHNSFLPKDFNRTIMPAESMRGIRKLIPHVPSIDLYPYTSSLTGFASVEPTSPDDDAPCGYMKGCALHTPFGKLRYDSNCVSADLMMRRFNRGDYTDVKLLSSILDFNPSVEWMQGLNQSEILSLTTMAEMVTVCVLMERALATQAWQGHSKLNQFKGLDRQISVGLVENEDGLPMPSLDSDVKDFQFDDIASGGRSIVEYLSMMSFYTRFQAQRSSLDPCEWVVAMRPEMWYALTNIWPSAYLGHAPRSGKPDWVCEYCGSKQTIPLTKCWNGKDGCGASKPPISGYVCTYCGRAYSKYRKVCWDGEDGCGGIESLEKVTEEFQGYFSALSSGDEVALRDWMRNNLQIPINGFLYNVVLDDGIFEKDCTNAAARLMPGEFASSIYFIPLTIYGGMPATYMEFLKYNDSFCDEKLTDGEFWTDGGMLKWKLLQDKWDYILSAHTQQRIVLKTPQLAGKVKNIKYSPRQLLKGD